jgi:hypothetical protein
MHGKGKNVALLRLQEKGELGLYVSECRQNMVVQNFSFARDNLNSCGTAHRSALPGEKGVLNLNFL